MGLSREETVKRNEAIAVFLGYLSFENVKCEVHVGHNCMDAYSWTTHEKAWVAPEYAYHVRDGEALEHYVTPDLLTFHQSWDELVPIMIEIAKLGNWPILTIRPEQVSIAFSKSKFPFDPLVSAESKNLDDTRLVVWKAVSDFCLEYNEKNNTIVSSTSA